MTVLYTNNATSTLAAPILSTDLSMDVQSGDGSLFPNPATAGEYFYVSLEDNTPNREIVKCTARSGDTLTIVRGQDGTTGLGFAAGTIVEVRPVRAQQNDIRNEATGYNVINKSATFTLNKDDNGSFFDCTGTFTINLDPFATFPTYFRIYVKNSGAGTVTVDANGSETIEGNPTYQFGPGDEGTIVVGVSEFRVFNKTSSVSRVLPRGYIDGMIMDNTARTGATLLTSFTNSGYDTFSSSTVTITSAIASTPGTKFARSNIFGTTIQPGQTVNVSLTLTLNSGQAPSIAIVDSVFGNVTVYVPLVNGANTIQLTCWGLGTYLEFRNTANSNWSTGSISASLQTLDQTEDIALLAGVARDATDAVNIELSAEILKSIDTAWAEGNAQGGMATGVGLSADTWFHFFAISKVDGTVDAGWDTNLSAANLLADAAGSGYVYYRRVGSVLTNGTSDIVFFVQEGNYFTWNASFLDFSGSASTSGVLIALSTPPDLNIMARININGLAIAGTSNNGSLLTESDQPNSSVTFTNSTIWTTANSLEESDSSEVLRKTDTSSQVRIRRLASQNSSVITLGYIDNRGKE